MRYIHIPVPLTGGITLDRDIVVVGLARNMADLASPGTAIPFVSISVRDNYWGLNIAHFDAEITPNIAAGHQPYLPMPPQFVPAGSTIYVSQPGSSGISGVGVAALPAGWQIEIVARLLERNDKRASGRMAIYVAQSRIISAGAVATVNIPVPRPFRLHYTAGLARVGSGANYNISEDHGVMARVIFSHYATTNTQHYVHLRRYGTRERPLLWTGERIEKFIQVDFQNANTAGTDRIATLLFMGLEET